MRRWPPEAREFYEERAGHRQFECYEPRVDAERGAEEDTRREWARGVFLGAKREPLHRG